MEKETGKVGRGGSQGSAQVGACLLHSSFPTQTSEAFPQHKATKPFSRTEGPDHGFGSETALSLLFEMGRSSNILVALPMHFWRESKLKMAWGFESWGCASVTVGGQELENQMGLKLALGKRIKTFRGGEENLGTREFLTREDCKFLFTSVQKILYR